MRKPRQAAGFRGTVRYAPISCHLQRELCRKDDAETWVYMLVRSFPKQQVLSSIKIYRWRSQLAACRG